MRPGMGSAPTEKQADQEPYGERYIFGAGKMTWEHRQEFHEYERKGGESTEGCDHSELGGNGLSRGALCGSGGG